MMRVFNQMLCVVAMSLGAGCMSSTNMGTNSGGACPVDNNYFVFGVESNGSCSSARLNECAPDANVAYDRTRASFAPTSTVYVCHNLDVSPTLLCLPDRGVITPLPAGCTRFEASS